MPSKLRSGRPGFETRVRSRVPSKPRSGRPGFDAALAEILAHLRGWQGADLRGWQSAERHARMPSRLRSRRPGFETRVRSRMPSKPRSGRPGFDRFETRVRSRIPSKPRSGRPGFDRFETRVRDPGSTPHAVKAQIPETRVRRPPRRDPSAARPALFASALLSSQTFADSRAVKRRILAQPARRSSPRRCGLRRPSQTAGRSKFVSRRSPHGALRLGDLRRQQGGQKAYSLCHHVPPPFPPSPRPPPLVAHFHAGSGDGIYVNTATM